MPRERVAGDEFGGRTFADRMLRKAARMLPGLQPLSAPIINMLSRAIQSPLVMGTTLRLPTYARSRKSKIQGSRLNTPWVFWPTKGPPSKTDLPQNGFFLVTTKRIGEPPFVILNPHGEPEKIGPEIRKVSEVLAEKSGKPVIVKNPHPMLIPHLEKLGFRHYKTGRKVLGITFGRHQWSRGAPQDDSTYKPRVAFFPTIMNWTGQRPASLLKRMHQLTLKLRQSGLTLTVENYNPDFQRHRNDAAAILQSAANRFEMRKGENPQNVIDAHRDIISIKPRRFGDSTSFILYAISKGKRGNRKKIPIGFSSYEKIGEFDPKDVEGLSKMGVSAEDVEKIRLALKNLDEFARANDKIIPEKFPVYSVDAGFARNDVIVKQTGLALAINSMVRMSRLSRENEFAIFDMGGSETLGLDLWKAGFGGFSYDSHHMVWYPRTSDRIKKFARYPLREISRKLHLDDLWYSVKGRPRLQFR
ncbi:MAG: hypothetical protein V1787_03965 [Candidatus Micrarchaeota archaeon]